MKSNESTSGGVRKAAMTAATTSAYARFLAKNRGFTNPKADSRMITSGSSNITPNARTSWAAKPKYSFAVMIGSRSGC